MSTLVAGDTDVMGVWPANVRGWCGPAGNSFIDAYSAGTSAAPAIERFYHVIRTPRNAANLAVGVTIVVHRRSGQW